jgi:DtxR family transcriptional regulator, Mn-dependent transcriptional regulator
MNQLTPSKEHYIKAIYALSAKEGSARISDIADALSVSKASVCVAMNSLRKLKLIKRNSEHRVLLTGEGRKKAILLTDKFTLIRQFLIKVLHVPPQTAKVDACAMEHIVSDETLLSMNGFLEHKSKKAK